jgi:hypothetical protein
LISGGTLFSKKLLSFSYQQTKSFPILRKSLLRYNSSVDLVDSAEDVKDQAFLNVFEGTIATRAVSLMSRTDCPIITAFELYIFVSSNPWHNDFPEYGQLQGTNFKKNKYENYSVIFKYNLSKYKKNGAQ